MTRAAGSRVDHYQLIRHLGDGAQAEVHLARNVLTGEEVVLKFPLARTLDQPALAARWRREVALTETLRHEGIQCRHDVSTRHREPYLVLDYASGGSLRGRIGGKGPPLSVAQVVAWGRQLLVALAYVHGAGIIHRDLKPENIYLTDQLTLKLGDFGAAVPRQRRTGRNWRRWLLASPPEGTPEYLSPEEITGSPVDQRSDIYAWGVVMYELLTGQVPFGSAGTSGAAVAGNAGGAGGAGGGSPWAVMATHLSEHPVPLRMLRPDAPAGLELVVMTALRRLPTNRYANAEAVLADLDDLDCLDPVAYDLGPEPPVSPGLGGGGLALLRFTLLVAAVFVGMVAAVIGVSVMLR